MSELDGVISSAPEGDELQQLKAHYPDASFHSRVKAYADQALAALGPTHLQVRLVPDLARYVWFMLKILSVNHPCLCSSSAVIASV